MGPRVADPLLYRVFGELGRPPCKASVDIWPRIGAGNDRMSMIIEGTQCEYYFTPGRYL